MQDGFAMFDTVGDPPHAITDRDCWRTIGNITACFFPLAAFQ